jgi:hypothetical protein
LSIDGFKRGLIWGFCGLTLKVLRIKSSSIISIKYYNGINVRMGYIEKLFLGKEGFY